MRSYLDIIEDLKDGKKPDYEEVRLACLMAASMLHFADQDIIRLTGLGKNPKADLQAQFAVKNLESRWQKSMPLPPDQYLGSWHPDAPGRQEERQRHQRIFDGIMKKMETESSSERQARMNCHEGNGVDGWDCYRDCAFWQGGRCTKNDEAD
jgi:hypothetical protein